MAFTKPQFCLPVVLDSASVVTVDRNGAANFNVNFPAGTYWNDRTLAAGDLLWDLAAALSTGDPGCSYVAVEPSTGLLGRPQLNLTVTDGFDRKLVFTSGPLTANLLGFATADVSSYTSSDFTGSKQRSHLWLPREYAVRDHGLPEANVVVARSAYDTSSTVLELGSWETFPVRVEKVEPALVYRSLNERSAYAAKVSGLVTGDFNATLEQLWEQHRTVEPLRYWEDHLTLGTYRDLVVNDEDWLRRLTGVSVWGSGSPLRFNVDVPAEEYTP